MHYQQAQRPSFDKKAAQTSEKQIYLRSRFQGSTQIPKEKPCAQVFCPCNKKEGKSLKLTAVSPKNNYYVTLSPQTEFLFDILLYV